MAHEVERETFPGTHPLLVEHHGRLAAVEVEARAARADAAAARAETSEVRALVLRLREDVSEVMGIVKPLAAAATAAHQQTSTLLTYLFAACLAVAGGAVSAWLSGMARLDEPLQVAIAGGASLVCVLVALAAIRHARRP